MSQPPGNGNSAPPKNMSLAQFRAIAAARAAEMQGDNILPRPRLLLVPPPGVLPHYKPQQ